MIPDIGLIIAAYTVVRFVQIMAHTEEKKLVQLLAFLGLLATLYLCWELVTASVRTTLPTGY